MDVIIGSSESYFPDNPCLDWICPALLILDVMTQPILFDKDNVVKTLREIRTHEDNTKSQEESDLVMCNGDLKQQCSIKTSQESLQLLWCCPNYSVV